MPDNQDARLSDFAADRTTETVTRTIKFKLETSETKNERVRTGIEEYQEMASYMSDILPTYPDYEWRPNHTTMYQHISDAFPKNEREVKATIAREAQQKVAEAFQSWRERGRDGDRPNQFGDGNLIRLSHQDLDIVENERGYGLKASFIPYNPVWFHIDSGVFQDRFLDRITDEDDDASSGSAELRLEDDGTLWCHLTVSWDVEVYESADVETRVGVDIGENMLYAVAVLDGNQQVQRVKMESGREYRHHRNRLKKKRAEAQNRGDLSTVRSTRLSYDKYTDHITNVASREIVDIAVEHRPSVIALEDLTDYREQAEDAIHDWPFAEIQEKIMYKSVEEGIPVDVIQAYDTSEECRKCGEQEHTNRDGDEFYCPNCDYEVHADVNAAMNIAQRSMGS